MIDYHALAADIRRWAAELGFQQVGVAGIELAADEAHLLNWLDAGHHGEMDYMARHGDKRSRPADLQPGTVRVISARMDYAPPGVRTAWDVINDGERGYVSRYALGRDYHKLLRSRLQKLADRIAGVTGPFGHRVFTDSAPVLEKALARNAGLGWIGKHTLLLDRDAGSWFFLGEIYTDLPLPVDTPASAHCGTCTRCIDVCPTQAIIAPHRLDARRCIAYLTIEHKGHIPAEFREAIGNRVFGCDDCLAVCPWNKFAETARNTRLAALGPGNSLPLAELLALDDAAFRRLFAGTPVKRTGRDRVVRNALIAAGNSGDASLLPAVERLLDDGSPLVRAMAVWALQRLAEPEQWQHHKSQRAVGEGDAHVQAEWA